MAGLRVRRVAALPSEDVRLVGRSRSTTGLRTALDLARCEPLPDSVAALDVLLGRRITDADDLTAAAAGLRGRGARTAQRAVGLADGRAESQPESRLRVGLLLGGLRPVPQHVVRDAEGRFIARVDLAFPEWKVAVEYDGAWHGASGQLRKDRRRLNDLVRAGWVVLHATAADMYDLPRVVRSAADLLAAAGCRDLGVRRALRTPSSQQSGGRRRP